MKRKKPFLTRLSLALVVASGAAGGNAATAVPEVIDLGGAARDLCLGQTFSAPRRPHILMFNAMHSHAIISFVATGHVLLMDAGTRAPVACIDVGEQAHAAVPSPDQTYVVMANQNGKLLQRINTDHGSNTFRLDPGATLDLATCTTPNGVSCQGKERPDNAPVRPIIDATGQFTFVTLRGGGLLVVDSRLTATPMRIVAEYDADTVHRDGQGGVEVAGKMYINSPAVGPRPIPSNLTCTPSLSAISRPCPIPPIPRHRSTCSTTTPTWPMACGSTPTAWC